MTVTVYTFFETITHWLEVNSSWRQMSSWFLLQNYHTPRNAVWEVGWKKADYSNQKIKLLLLHVDIQKKADPSMWVTLRWRFIQRLRLKNLNISQKLQICYVICTFKQHNIFISIVRSIHNQKRITYQFDKACRAAFM